MVTEEKIRAADSIQFVGVPIGVALPWRPDVPPILTAQSVHAAPGFHNEALADVKELREERNLGHVANG